ncbi:MATE family efflux transporter [Spiroplasma eriocheiris]|uniref:MATE efflux family protein n=1 Tax=Spiroplasma eriocheiris TaxID=315358 RepID=A0A0H3XJG8_9MOLU|nr:MATE family efflux transporter [Spiroplasma eriocheiris]AHF58295.1 hypothetical protein SPE_1183 [Spiroplasma eriocheiris CCTCC M 207170]AKM54730.1 hypothetical protein SERIO_v1c11810 [Spiroplasma eriocheiris]
MNAFEQQEPKLSGKDKNLFFAKLKIKDAKLIWKLTFPIFLQFTPSLIASGTLIVCGNLIGQQRENELSDVIVSGLVVNFLICTCLAFIMFMIAPFLLSALSAQDANIPGTNINELQFAIQYYRFLLLRMIVMSITQVFISGLQACKHNRHVMIGAIISNIIDIIIVTLMLFVFKINILYTAFTIVIAGVFQLFYMLGFNLKYINYHNGHHFFQKINLKFIKETVFLGVPIAAEMGIWNVANLINQMAIAKLGDELLSLNRAVSTVIQYATVFTQALATVCSVLVANKIGEDDKEGAYQYGIQCWKFATYVSFVGSLIILALTYPLLKIFNMPTTLINSCGYYLFLILVFKMTCDTVNLTILRALWAANDVWFPLIVSIFSMFIWQDAFAFMIISGFKVTGTLGLILIYLGTTGDPITRSLIYARRWVKRTWYKYAKKL